MSFSLSSLFFVFGVFVLFYLIRRRARAYFLLVSSLVFIGYLDVRSCIWVVVVTTIVYLLGLIVGQHVDRGFVKSTHFTAAFGVIACVCSLFLLKHVAKWSCVSGVFTQFVLPLV